ncbi:MAG: FAD-dependent oxidoreductase [Actinomycetes bacterium]
MAHASDEVLVVGGGIAGIACARALHDADVPVVVRDRGRRLGGRMAVRTVEGRPVDVGASYVTATHPLFVEQVERWQADQLIEPWTDTFHVATPEGIAGTTTGPMRYRTPLGLRSLVESLAVGLAVLSGDDVGEVGPGPTADGRRQAAVVLAMPDPQALDVLSDDLVDVRSAASHSYQPSLTLVTHWDRRSWPRLDGVFVNDSAVLTWIADDGRRRGDDAPVLVAHAAPVLAAEHLDHPDGAAAQMVSELRCVLGISDEPRSGFVQRWSLARPAESSTLPFHLGEHRVGLCGDGWHGSSKVESAFLSGRGLGHALRELVA